MDPKHPVPPSAEQVVLVDEADAETGTLEKLRAHVEGRLHRALSVFVFNERGDVLLQRRAASKYHSGGQWTNTCCSHPRPGEPVAAAARRRLREEMGFECDLSPAFAFTYRAEVGGGLVEHELDHVFVGRWEGAPAPDATEVDGWRWASLDEIARDAAAHPDAYTPWLRMIVADPRFLEQLSHRGTETQRG